MEEVDGGDIMTSDRSEAKPASDELKSTSGKDGDGSEANLPDVTSHQPRKPAGLLNWDPDLCSFD